MYHFRYWTANSKTIFFFNINEYRHFFTCSRSYVVHTVVDPCIRNACLCCSQMHIFTAHGRLWFLLAVGRETKAAKAFQAPLHATLHVLCVCICVADNNRCWAHIYVSIIRAKQKSQNTWQQQRRRWRRWWRWTVYGGDNKQVQKHFSHLFYSPFELNAFACVCGYLLLLACLFSLACMLIVFCVYYVHT